MWKIRDRWNNEIELTDERWQHIKYWHPDLKAHLEEVIRTIRLGKRHQDDVDPYKYIYFRETKKLLPNYNHIVVVAKLIHNKFVITAYPIFR